MGRSFKDVVLLHSVFRSTTANGDTSRERQLGRPGSPGEDKNDKKDTKESLEPTRRTSSVGKK